MVIDVSALRRERGGSLRRDFLLGDEGLDYHGDHYTIARPTPVRALLTNTGKAVRADVAAHLGLTCPCDRCLEPYSFGVDLAYTEEFLTPAQAEDAGIDGEAEDDGRLRRVVTPGDTVSLDEGFWQNVILALPMKHLCSADCRGICPKCGQNRNRVDCGCDVEPRDPRLAGLERIFREER